MPNNVSAEYSSEGDYLAFISYRHADNREDDRKWATWLHTQLEAYEVPADLIDTTNSRGETIPERIYPVFRDELSLPADASLEDSISRSLDRSRFLVVLCSTRAAESRYVNEEILRFKKIGRSDRIIAVILDGEPNSSTNEIKAAEGLKECFPEALRYKLDENGQLDHSRPAEPIAADFRLIDGSQGFTNPGVYRRELEQHGLSSREASQRAETYEEYLNNARLKIIAGILGVSLERITERDKVHQLAKAKASAKRSRRIATVMAVLTITAVLAGFYAYIQFQRAESTLADLRSNLGFMNVDLRMLLTSYVPSEQRGSVIKQIDRVVASLQQHGRESHADQRQFAAALKHKADELKSSDPTKALELYTQSLLMHQLLVQSDPNDSKWQHDLSVAFIEIGDFHLDRSELDLALAYFQKATSVRQKLVEREPLNEDWRRELSASRNRESIVLQKLGKFEGALAELRASLRTAERAVELEPDKVEAIRDLYIAWNLIGSTQQEAGNLPEALKAFREGIGVNKKAFERDPSNLRLKRDLSVSYTNLGDVLLELGDPTAAIKWYQAGKVLAQELHSIDRNQPLLTTDLAGNYVGLGRAFEATAPDMALDNFYKARDLIDPVITAGQLDNDRRELPDIISKAINRLEAASK